MKAPLYNKAGEIVEQIELSGSIFGVEGDPSLVHRAVVRHLANGRQGSASTKTRAEVAGGGRKPWRQKGTGRARHGSIRSPIWRGGGVTFGPRPRDFSVDLPRRQRRLALRLALSAKARDGGVSVIDGLAMEAPKTRELASTLNRLGDARSTLIVTAAADRNVVLSARNLPSVRTIEARNLNVYDVVKYDRLLLTRDALDRLQEVLVQ